MYAVTRFTKKTLMKINLFWSCENPFEYINDWEKFNETTLPERERGLLQSPKHARYYYAD